jgi:hypothetical protein
LLLLGYDSGYSGKEFFHQTLFLDEVVKNDDVLALRNNDRGGDHNAGNNSSVFNELCLDLGESVFHYGYPFGRFVLGLIITLVFTAGY